MNPRIQQAVINRHVQTAVLRRSGQAGIPRFLLLVLAYHADENGRVDISYQALAADTGLPEWEVKETLKGLVRSGELVIERPGVTRRSPRYRIRLPL